MNWGLFGTKREAMIWRSWHQREFPFNDFAACESAQVEARDAASARVGSLCRSLLFCARIYWSQWWWINAMVFLIETVASLSVRPGTVFNDCGHCSNTHADNFHSVFLLLLPSILNMYFPTVRYYPPDGNRLWSFPSPNWSRFCFSLC